MTISAPAPVMSNSAVAERLNAVLCNTDVVLAFDKAMRSKRSAMASRTMLTTIINEIDTMTSNYALSLAPLNKRALRHKLTTIVAMTNAMLAGTTTLVAAARQLDSIPTPNPSVVVNAETLRMLNMNLGAQHRAEDLARLGIFAALVLDRERR